MENIGGYDYYSILVCTTQIGALCMFFALKGFTYSFCNPLSRHYQTEGVRNIERILAILNWVCCIDFLLWVIFTFLAVRGDCAWESREYLRFFDSLCLPVMGLAGISLITQQMPNAKLWALVLAPVALLFMARVITGDYLYNLILNVWSIAILAYLVAKFTIKLHKYNKALKEEYSNIDNRTLGWFLWLTASFFGCMIIYITIGYSYTLLNQTIYHTLLLVFFIITYYKAMQLRFSTVVVIDDADDSIAVEKELPKEIKQKDNSVLAEALRQLEKDQFYLDSDISLQALADRIGSNRTYLSNYLNREMGMNFYLYTNSLRLEHAAKLLETETMDKPSFVWTVCGFKNSSTFYSLFKEKYNCTPLQYYNQFHQS